MIKISIKIISFLIIASLISCGSTKMPLTVNSTPSGASIRVDGEYSGITPNKLYLNKKSHTVLVEKSGYSNQREIINPKTTMTFGGFLFLPFWILSPEWKFEPNNLHFTLEKK